ncbi:hypothetical protein PR048_016815 [Dryococelus australis]|uniref:Uncharacterized protein n=1 Tax=Dryococelus australis TaxID=614101 RepID=A0ABQ9H7T7_9NEOP|nr:hypothetical protein PR048_016815 [Dryococelus australis]
MRVIEWKATIGASLLEEEGQRWPERLDRAPPTKANRVQSPTGSPEFRMWESCQTMALVGGFSRGSPVSPLFNSVRNNRVVQSFLDFLREEGGAAKRRVRSSVSD